MKRFIAAAILCVAVVTPVSADWWDFHHPSFAWCGAYMRDRVQELYGITLGPAFNRAAEWVHFGTPADGPAPGVIGVQQHHVVQVISVPKPGRIVAISGNDGHRVRIRERSTSKIIAWRWPSHEYHLASTENHHDEVRSQPTKGKALHHHHHRGRHRSRACRGCGHGGR